MASIVGRRRFLQRLSKCKKETLKTLLRYASTSTSQSTLQYCVNLVRRIDYENFLCSLLIPKSSRNSVLSIRAFNAELAQVRDSVSERDIGRMRMQFWKDTLQSIYKGSAPQHPVALELAKAVEKHKLSKMWFTRMIEARESNLDERAYPNTKSLETYAENSASSVLYLTLESLGVKDVNADHAASHVGKAFGIVTLLRATPYHGNRGKVLLPNDILIKHGVSHQDIIRGSTSQPVKDAGFELASLANTHLNMARALKSKLPKAALRALLPAVSCQEYLNHIQRADFDLFHPTLRERNQLLPLSLIRHAWTRKY
ncbi:NADH dehydrogenase (ubiquinone) complex I, assembly factor 6 [Nematostella vectensis]|uniref:NADH dehydrogenase (ubiquinone) complex I, assembly factor 6 n=1 Tax=Nematostella vectensis TaxID=45351 RepID=UPI002076D5FA|nr:NADH dehydrogenase (ubiquinone) complex I, assembly factor 6 [Nematostella vectensis]